MTIASKPAELFGRDIEWGRLMSFARPATVGAGLAIMYGRRRQGKTALLEAATEATNGFYWQALQQSSAQNLRDFSQAWSAWRGHPNTAFPDWTQAIRALFEPSFAGSQLVSLDEFGYLIDGAPEVPSVIQSCLTPSGVRNGTTRLVVCGSSFSQIRQLLSSSAPLRGRATLELVVGPFDYRTAANYWGLDGNLDAAFRLHALVGGTPGYLPLAGAAPRQGNIDRWLAEHVLNTGSPLFREGRVLVGEDPVLSDRSLYWGVLAAIADGKRRRSDIAKAVGRLDSALSFPLKVLVDGDYIEQRPDPLHRGRSTWLLNDPIVRLHRVVIEPEQRRLTRGLATEVIVDNRGRIAQLIYGPHLEWLAAEWVLAHATGEEIGGRPRLVGAGVLAARGQRHQLDLIATEPAPNGGDHVHAIGEVKADLQRVAVGQLDRLDTIAPLLGARAAPAVQRVLVSRGGFTAELERTASHRHDVTLVDLDRLYGH